MILDYDVDIGTSLILYMQILCRKMKRILTNKNRSTNEHPKVRRNRRRKEEKKWNFHLHEKHSNECIQWIGRSGCVIIKKRFELDWPRNRESKTEERWRLRMAQSNLTMFGWVFIMNFIMKENVRFKFNGSTFANGGESWPYF